MKVNSLYEGDPMDMSDRPAEYVTTTRLNPYNVGKLKNRADKLNEKIRKLMSRRSAPFPRGYVWRIGYNHIVGQWTGGNKFPELSGSSLNRTKIEKDVPADARGIIKMAFETASKYCRASQGPCLEFDGRKVLVSDIYADIVICCTRGDLAAARELAVRFSVQVRKCYVPVSYGVHMLSPRSRGKIKDKATAFFRSCPGDRIFATFSFIAPVDDKTGMSVLNKFLTASRKKYPGLQYFWVAERQTGERNENRGVFKDPTNNIHFHMILNKRLPIGKWNALWVLQQYNSGLVGHDEWGREIYKEYIKELYALDVKEGFKGAIGKSGKKISRIQQVLNPLDIKKVKSITALSGYLTKYITNQEKNIPFGCSVWHCSRRVSKLFIKNVVPPSAFAYMNSLANCKVDKKTGEILSFPFQYQAGNGYAVVVFAMDKAAPLRYLRRLEQANKWILDGLDIRGLPMLDDGLYRKHFICKD
jgi:hypothetical protein